MYQAYRLIILIILQFSLPLSLYSGIGDGEFQFGDSNEDSFSEYVNSKNGRSVSGEDEGFFQVMNGPPTPPPPAVPFDGGLSLLLSAMTLGGIKLLKEARKK